MSRFDTGKVEPPKIDLYSDAKQWCNIKDLYMLSPIYGGNGRVLIMEDPFKSQFECTTCHGKGHLGVVCKYCKGTKWDKADEERGYCRDCTVGVHGVGKTLGYEKCETCGGTGGTIITPDESQRNSLTGNVLAISKNDVQHVKVNDKVMFTNYTGHSFKFMGTDFRICIERDLLCIVKQLKENVPNVEESTMAELENTGVAHV